MERESVGIIGKKSVRVVTGIETDVAKVFLLMMREREGLLTYLEIFMYGRYEYFMGKSETSDYISFIEYVCKGLENIVVNLDGVETRCFDCLRSDRQTAVVRYVINKEFYDFVTEK